ncbi:MAG: hypothetical protein SAJ12_18395, partial [Jaaginema sp. PMC 1079.18]|nr:hypothetical protein [Jaaginema sp. PMC 1079.18]
HKGNWLVYIMSLILGYYSHLYFIFFAFSQVVYVAIQQKFKFTKAARSFAIAFTLGSLAFLPWLVVIFSNLAKIDKITSSAQKSVATTVIIKALVANLGQVFIDVGLGTYFAPLVLVLVLYAFYYLIRYAPNSTWQFIVVLVGINAAAIILPDLILGGQGSTRSRYFIPCYIGIEIAVAYLIVLKLKSRRQISQYVGLILAVFVFGGGFISDGISAQSEVWWNKGHSRYNLEIARIINQTEQPLVLSDIYSLNPIDFLALSHYLKPDVQFRLGEMGDRELQNFPLDANLFVYNPSPQMRESLEKYYQVQPFQHHIKLLRLKSHANSSSANSE